MRNENKISVLIPLYRGRSSIKACLESLLAQRDVVLEILLLDNGCPEDTGEWAGYFLAREFPNGKWQVLEVPENVGFAAGNNLLYSKSTFPFILFLNQDVELAGGALIKMVSTLASNPDRGGVGGVLVGKSENNSEKVVDTAGHVIFRDRIVRNRGKGMKLEPVESIPWPEGEVFGLSAACSMYRRDAIESAREPEGPFDPGFFSYFEDIDLDYRMHRAGWKLGFIPVITGAHVLAGSGARRELKVRIRAYGNRRRIMWKHESFASLFPDMMPVLLQDIYGSVRALFTDPAAWVAGPLHFLRGFGDVLKRRKDYDRRWGTDRDWIRKWLRPQSERYNRVE